MSIHSVSLDAAKCKGCTNCIKRCPTEAIRVRDGKASITPGRCIDCGVCISVCPYHAKLAMTDEPSILASRKYSVALPAPSLYGQFNHDNIDDILAALIGIGFDDVFEVAFAASLITAATRELMSDDTLPKPLISSACPAVVKLIHLRFPSLVPNIVPLVAPMELAAALAKALAVERTGLSEADVGVYFITPCAAKYTAVRSPMGIRQSYVDGVISIKDLFTKLRQSLKEVTDAPERAQSYYEGIRWAAHGGEAYALGGINSISVDGIQHVVGILEDIEDERLEDIDFVEAGACSGGCVGGPLTIENPYVARARIERMKQRRLGNATHPNYNDRILKLSKFVESIRPSRALQLDDNIAVALRKLEQINQLQGTLPDLDCGSCGAPSCRALAEDIVQGDAMLYDCIFKMRDKIRELAKEMVELESVRSNRI